MTPAHVATVLSYATNPPQRLFAEEDRLLFGVVTAKNCRLYSRSVWYRDQGWPLCLEFEESLDGTILRGEFRSPFGRVAFVVCVLLSGGMAVHAMVGGSGLELLASVLLGPSLIAVVSLSSKVGIAHEANTLEIVKDLIAANENRGAVATDGGVLIRPRRERSVAETPAA